MRSALFKKELDIKQDSDLSGIIRGCQQKEASCQEKLYKQFYGYALSVAMKYCPDREDAIEVVNDSFMKVFNKIHIFEISKPFKPWLRRIVINTSIDRLRKNFRDHVDMDMVTIEGTYNTEEDVSIKEIYRLLNDLPDLYRVVFSMYEVDGYSHKEIAQQLGIGESSSRTYLMRAKNRLRILYYEYFSDGKGVR